MIFSCLKAGILFHTIKILKYLYFAEMQKCIPSSFRSIFCSDCFTPFFWGNQIGKNFVIVKIYFDNPTDYSFFGKTSKLIFWHEDFWKDPTMIIFQFSLPFCHIRSGQYSVWRLAHRDIFVNIFLKCSDRCTPLLLRTLWTASGKKCQKICMFQNLLIFFWSNAE